MSYSVTNPKGDEMKKLWLVFLVALLVAAPAQAVEKNLRWTDPDNEAQDVTGYRVEVSLVSNGIPDPARTVNLLKTDISAPDGSGVYTETVDLGPAAQRLFVRMRAFNTEAVSLPSNENRFVILAAPVLLGSLGALFITRNRRRRIRSVPPLGA